MNNKPVGTPAAHSLNLQPSTAGSNDYHILPSPLRTNYVTDHNAVQTTNGFSNGQNSGALSLPTPQQNGSAVGGGAGTIRETQTIQKTEVLHVDTNSEPMA